MKKNYLFFCLMGVLNLSLWAQRASSYRFQATVQSYTPITGTPLAILQGEYAATTPIDIGFTFNFGGVNYTRFRATTEGFITFDTTASTLGMNSNTSIRLVPLIAPLWDELSGTSATAQYQLQGTAPNRILVMQWSSWRWPATYSTQLHHFQVKLYETSNRIDFHYGSGSASNAQMSSSRTAFVGLAASPTDFLTLTGTTDAPTVSNTISQRQRLFPATGQVYTFLPATCGMPSQLTTDSIIDTRVSLGWKVPTIGTPTNYIWRVTNNAGVLLQSGSTTQNRVAVEGLLSSTIYRATIAAKCGVNDSSNWISPVSFTTEWLRTPLPYSYGFETDSIGETGSTPWNAGRPFENRWYSKTTDAYGPIQAAEGNVFAVFSGLDGRDSSIQRPLLSPIFSTLGRTKRLTFKYWIGDNPSYRNTIGRPPLELRVTRNNVATVLKEYRFRNATFTNNRSAGWQTDTIDLVGYENQLLSFSFWAREASSEPLSAIAIDDFKLENAPTCVSPVNLNAISATPQTMQISWQSVNQNRWEVEYGSTGFALGQGTRVITTTNPVTISNLASSNTYDFYVRALCSASDSSAWSVRKTASVLCDYITNFPYQEGFDSLPFSTCWKRESPRLGAGWEILYDSNFTDRYMPFNGRGYLHTPLNESNLVYTLTSPAFSLGATPKQLTYHYILTSGGYTVSFCEVPVSVEISTDGLNWSNLWVHTCTNSQAAFSKSWMRQTIPLTSYANQTVLIRFKYKNIEAHRFILDEFRVEEVNSTCRPPSDLGSSGIRQDTTAELAWTKGAQETSWELEYGNNAFRLGTGTRVTIQNGIPRYILRGDLNKEFYVRGICGAGTYTQWVGPIKVVHNKRAIYNIYGQPFDENFSRYYEVDIQTKGFGKNTVLFLKRNSFDYNFVAALHSVQMAILPRALNIKAGTHQLRFKIVNRAFNVGKLQVGVMSTLSDTVDFRLWAELNLSGHGITTEHTIPFSGYNLDKEFIVFKYVVTGVAADFSVDSIAWEKIPSVAMPQAIRLDSVRYNRVSVSWQTGTSGTVPIGYKWRIQPARRNVYDRSMALEGTAASNQVTVHGLVPYTEYDFYLQPYGNTLSDTSAYWSEGIRFKSAVVNDECVDAIPLSNYASSSAGLLNATPMLAGLYKTEGLPIDAFNSQLRNDIWYTVTTPDWITPLTIRSQASFFMDDWGMVVYSGSSCANLSVVAAIDDYQTQGDFSKMPEYKMTTYTPNTRYWVKMWYDSGDNQGRIWAYCNGNCTPTPPQNDDCERAISLTTTDSIVGSTAGATYQANQPLTCGIGARDVWYKYRVDTGANRVTRCWVEVSNPNAAPIYYSIFSGNCGNFQLRSGCQTVAGNSSRRDTVFLSESEQFYYIRVWSAQEQIPFTLKLGSIQNFGNIGIANALTTTVCQPFTRIQVDSSNYNSWICLMDSNRIVAEINPRGNYLRQVTGGYYINTSGTLRRASGVPYLDRNIGIRVDSQPLTDVRVRLYFTEQERANYAAIVGSNPVAVTRYSGALCLPTTQAGRGDLLSSTIQQAPNGNYYVEFDTRHFSGFFIGPNQSLVFTEEVEKGNDAFKIEYWYPMPVRTDLNITFRANRTTDLGKIYITDVLGKVVFEQSLSIVSGVNEVQLKLAELVDGLYILNLSDGVHRTSKKLVKQ